MTILKTCLLLSDDPDDFQILGEGLKEVSNNIIILMCADGTQVGELLMQQHIKPDYLLIDYFLTKLNCHQLLLDIKQSGNLKDTRIGVFGIARPADFPDDCTFFARAGTYSETKEMLTRLVNNS
jgi:hypothetical protein